MTDLDSIIPCARVLDEARGFLQECHWSLEIDDQIVVMPPDLELVVRSRAFIAAEAPDIFLGDHYEAVVFLGREILGRNWLPKYGYLKLYFSREGRFVSEDHYAPRAEPSGRGEPPPAIVFAKPF